MLIGGFRVIAQVVLFAALFASCATVAPVGPFNQVPARQADQCAAICQDLGMRMSAFVVVANRTGCVCAPEKTASSASDGSAAVVAGALATEQEVQASTH